LPAVDDRYRWFLKFLRTFCGPNQDRHLPKINIVGAHRMVAPSSRYMQHGLMASARERVREHRRRLRAQGLRPIQIWVPDVRAPEFVAEAHRQSAAIAASEHEAADQAFVDAVSVDWDDEAESTE
jgi:hypothetical protein